MQSKKQSQSGQNAVPVAGAAVRLATVTQRELKAVLDAQCAVDALCAAIQRRRNAGAAVEPGRLFANQEHSEPPKARRKDVAYRGFEIYPSRESVTVCFGQ